MGGDEFRPPVTGFDRLLLALAGDKLPKVAILPTAAAQQNPQLAAANGVGHFQALGAEAYAVMIVDSDSANDPALADQLGEAGLIYLCGGSPILLRDCLRDSLAWNRLLEMYAQGAIIAGSSAGAMVLCETMLHPGPPSPGLGLLPGLAVAPHFERRGEDAVSDLRKGLAAELTVLGIDGGTGCILRDGEWQVRGVGRVLVMRQNSVTTCTAGASFRLD